MVEISENCLTNIVKNLNISRENKVKMDNGPILNAGKLFEKYIAL